MAPEPNETVRYIGHGQSLIAAYGVAGRQPWYGESGVIVDHRGNGVLLVSFSGGTFLVPRSALQSLSENGMEAPAPLPPLPKPSLRRRVALWIDPSLKGDPS